AAPPPDVAGPVNDGGGDAGGGAAASGAKKSGCAGCTSASSSMGDAGAVLAGLGVLVLVTRRRSKREVRRTR
ncbi:MAG: hypothetical protein QOI41_246, partial [Myxococcales bacterium]|nr:hypothetical protein [Myxococcales bacterium]